MLLYEIKTLVVIWLDDDWIELSQEMMMNEIHHEYITACDPQAFVLPT